MTLWFKPMKYKTLASAWINTDKSGKKYLAVTLAEDMKAGDKLFLRKNDFKKDGDQSPDYRYSVKVQEDEQPQEEPSLAEEVADEIPF